MADPIDTDAMRAWVDAYYPKGTHLTMQYRLALAEVDRLRFENTALADTINELAVLYEDQTGAPPHISTGVVEPNRG